MWNAMLVAYELGKTMSEPSMANMPLQEMNSWLAFFNVKAEREAEEMRKAQRRQRNR